MTQLRNENRQARWTRSRNRLLGDNSGAERHGSCASRTNRSPTSPFAGTWGVTTSVSHALAGDIAQAELAASAALWKDYPKNRPAAHQRASAAAVAGYRRGHRQQVADHGGFAAVEAANGFVNISFDANMVASKLIGEVLASAERYGQGPDRTERVMVEHSQPNMHKVFHVGHLRNTSLGIAISNILAKAGYPVTQSNYPGDIGMHVIRALWCYERFHKGQEPADPAQRGRWMAQVYAESNARLSTAKMSSIS